MQFFEGKPVKDFLGTVDPETGRRTMPKLNLAGTTYMQTPPDVVGLTPDNRVFAVIVPGVQPEELEERVAYLRAQVAPVQTDETKKRGL